MIFRWVLVATLVASSLTVGTPVSSAASCQVTKQVMPSIKAKETVNSYAKRVFQASGGASKDALPLKLIIDPKVGSSGVKLITDGVQAASRYWSKYQTIDHPLNVLIAQDPVFARKQLPESMLREWDMSTGNGTREINTADLRFDGLLFFNPRGIDVNDMSTKLVGSHELFHMFQSYASNQRSQNVAEIPVWLVEGTAAYFSIALMDGKGNSARNEYLRRLKNLVNVSNGKPLSLRAFKEGTQLDFSNEEASRRSQQVYSSGTLAGEYLVSKAGVGALMSLFSCLKDGQPWDSNFKAITGMTSDQFYKEADAYVAQVFAGKEPIAKR